jgi:5'-deoxynucleotidase YfbR-like HD superfamily hydrolase
MLSVKDMITMNTINVYENRDAELFELGSEEQLAISLQQKMENVAKQVTSLGAIAMQFSEIERVPRYNDSSRENDAEHSFMLSLVAADLAGSYFPDLNPGLVAQFSNVHDLIELETGDVATFLLDSVELANKEAVELSAVDTVAGTLSPYTRELFLRYEKQEEPEARFVRLVDKILPNIVNIVGSGMKVMNEDYDVTTPVQLSENEDRINSSLRQRFPENGLDSIHRIRVQVAQDFSTHFANHAVALNGC